MRRSAPYGLHDDRAEAAPGRWNLVAHRGQPVADRFLAAHRATTDRALDDEPSWDLVSPLDLRRVGGGPGAIDPGDLRRLTGSAAAARPRWR